MLISSPIIECASAPAARPARRGADTWCCVAFAGCSVAGAVWFYFSALAPVLYAW